MFLLFFVVLPAKTTFTVFTITRVAVKKIFFVVTEQSIKIIEIQAIDCFLSLKGITTWFEPACPTETANIANNTAFVDTVSFSLLKTLLQQRTAITFICTQAYRRSVHIIHQKKD